MAARAARDLSGARRALLGPGLPAIVADHLPDGVLLGGGSRPDVAVLGATRVSAAGCALPGAPGPARGAGKVIVLMEHTAGDGAPRLVRARPAADAGRGAVDRVITDLAVVDFTADGPVLREIAPGATADEVRALTGFALLTPARPAPMAIRAGAAGPDRRWWRERELASDYAATRLVLDGRGADPRDFGVVWADMERGLRAGELRLLPPLAEAFEDWLREAAR